MPASSGQKWADCGIMGNAHNARARSSTPTGFSTCSLEGKANETSFPGNRFVRISVRSVARLVGAQSDSGRVRAVGFERVRPTTPTPIPIARSTAAARAKKPLMRRPRSHRSRASVPSPFVESSNSIRLSNMQPEMRCRRRGGESHDQTTKAGSNGILAIEHPRECTLIIHGHPR